MILSPDYLNIWWYTSLTMWLPDLCILHICLNWTSDQHKQWVSTILLVHNMLYSHFYTFLLFVYWDFQLNTYKHLQNGTYKKQILWTSDDQRFLWHSKTLVFSKKLFFLQFHRSIVLCFMVEESRPNQGADNKIDKKKSSSLLLLQLKHSRALWWTPSAVYIKAQQQAAWSMMMSVINMTNEKCSCAEIPFW